MANSTSTLDLGPLSDSRTKSRTVSLGVEKGQLSKKPPKCFIKQTLLACLLVSWERKNYEPHPANGCILGWGWWTTQKNTLKALSSWQLHGSARFKVG